MAKALRRAGKLLREGSLAVRGTDSTCCCASPGGKCSCTQATSLDRRECPDTGDELCCSAYEWDATYSASGSATCGVDASMWVEATSSQIGLWSSSSGIPSPAPDNLVVNNLLDSSWSMDYTVTQRCTDGVTVRTTEGTYIHDYSIYGDTGGGTYGYLTDSLEINFSYSGGPNEFDRFSGDFFGAGAIADPDAIPPPAMPDAIDGAIHIPLLLQPQSGCSQNYNESGIAITGHRYPWLPFEDIAPSLFYPQEGFSTFSGTTAISRTCTARSGSASETWVLQALDISDPLDTVLVGAGSASRSYTWSCSVTVVTECDPDPCEE